MGPPLRNWCAKWIVRQFVGGVCWLFVGARHAVPVQRVRGCWRGLLVLRRGGPACPPLSYAREREMSRFHYEKSKCHNSRV